ncbi:hypothetical protein DN730_13300 [Marinomonas piezotolerans]|uniref:Chemotaxis protein n=1 Tax=Marinomonas piezotolerans TaxID=2213058 RepID=A0A370U7G2_9GAMM|nr:hypothetical protein [Marinomonas piezotolerans]RDL43717.1 hypothetical protein DN730_13300 [Marinomonas piezotolerans]
MGGSSKSSNKTVNNVTNYSLQGMESAETVVAGDGNTVTTTDHGAVDGAFALGSEALGFAENALEIGGEVINGNTEVSKLAINANGELAKDALNQGFGFGESALEANSTLADNALKQVSVFGSEALDANTKALNNSFEFGTTAIESNNEALQTGFGFAESLVQQNTANAAANNLAMKELAKSVSTGGASDIASQSLKTVYTIGGVSVAVVLGLLLIKGGK